MRAIHTQTHHVHAVHQFPNLKYGALDEPFCRSVKRLSALRPSPTNNTSLEAGGVSGVF